MKKLLILILLFSNYCFSQVGTPSGFVRISSKYYWDAVMGKLVVVPAFAGTPTLYAGQYTGAGLIAVDSTNSKFYFYNGGWKSLVKATDTASKWLTRVYRRSDSVFYALGGVETFAFKDSTGGGGGGGLSGSGTAARLALWSGTATLANSLIRDNGTSVGVGTSSFTDPLSATTNFTAHGSFGDLWYKDNYLIVSNGSKHTLLYADGNGAHVGSLGAYSMTLQTNNNDRVTVQNDGKVLFSSAISNIAGFGTDTIGSNIWVRFGDKATFGTDNSNALTFSQDQRLTLGYGPIMMLVGGINHGTGGVPGPYVAMGAYSNHNLVFETGGNRRMIIDSSLGYVGINMPQTSGGYLPTARLDVNGDLRVRTLSSFTDTTTWKAAVTDGNGNFRRATYWPVGGSGSGVTTVGTFSGSSQTNGASISTTTITFGPADATNPGMVSTGAQTFVGLKTFTDHIRIPDDSYPAKLIQLGSSSNSAFIAAESATKGFAFVNSNGGKSGFYTSGAAAIFTVDDNGNVRMGNGGAPSSTYPFLVDGNSRFIGTSFHDGSTFLGGTSAPTALLHINAGTTTSGTAPIKVEDGALTTSSAANQIEHAKGWYFGTAHSLRYANGGVIADFTSDVSNSSTTETDLLSYNTIANSLEETGQKFTAIYSIELTDESADKIIRGYFAGTQIFSSGTFSGTLGTVVINVTIIRTGSSTARVTVTGELGGVGFTKYTALTGLDFTTINNLKITGQASGATGGSGDITATLGTILWWGAAHN